MKHLVSIAIFLVSVLCALPAQDRVTVFGGEGGWKPLSVSRSITEGKGRLGAPALILDSRLDGPSPDGTASRTRSGADMRLSFDGEGVLDETGNYRAVSSSVVLVGAKSARHGAGAALATGGDSLFVMQGAPGSFFSTPGRLGSFTISYWIRPKVVDNGAVIVRWRSSRAGLGSPSYQSIRSSVMNSRVEWNFSNVWCDSAGKGVELTLRGKKPLIPERWSRHEISYDSESGLVLYMIDGSVDDVRFMTSTGTERGEVFTALMGSPADVEFLRGYSGLFDEFEVIRSDPRPDDLDSRHDRVARFPRDGGRFETMPVDTGDSLSSVIGVTSSIHCPPETDVALFVRAGDNRFEWTDSVPAWVAIVDGKPASEVRGRFFQVAGNLYTDGSRQKTPTVTSIAVNWKDDDPPWPPIRLMASAGDGSVTLRWNASVNHDVAGYLVYYGTRSGEYLEKGSPIDAGPSLELTIAGLRNGTAYYFAVAAYDAGGPSHAGSLSVEAHARPRHARVAE